MKTRLVVPEANGNPRPYNEGLASHIFPFRICTGSPNEKRWKPEQPVNRGGENAKSPAPADKASNLELYGTCGNLGRSPGKVRLRCD
jgi:hypothetical protein